MSWTRGESGIWAEFKEWDEHGGLGDLDMGRQLYYRVNGFREYLYMGWLVCIMASNATGEGALVQRVLAFEWRSYTVYKKYRKENNMSTHPPWTLRVRGTQGPQAGASTTRAKYKSKSGRTLPRSATT